MADTSRHRMAANSLTQRSQDILTFKQRIIKNEHFKSSRIIEKEHEDRKRVLIKQKVNLKCHYTDISAERTRTVLKSLRRDVQEKQDKEPEQLPTIPRKSRSRGPGLLTKSKSESYIPVAIGTATASNSRASSPLTQTTKLCPLPSIRIEQKKQNLPSKRSPKLSLQETEILASSPELSLEDLVHCRYLRMPPDLHPATVHRSLPSKLPQLSEEQSLGKQHTITGATGYWKEVL
jgi:hypothetical protein